MPELDLEILRRQRREDVFRASGNPENAGWLRSQLVDWLDGHKWHTSRWGEFELVARPAGRGGPRTKVRAA